MAPEELTGSSAPVGADRTTAGPSDPVGSCGTGTGATAGGAAGTPAEPRGGPAVRTAARTGGTGVARPRRTADRTGWSAAPAHRRAGVPRQAPLAFTVALVAADCAAVLPAALVLAPGQRSAGLLLALTVLTVALHAAAGLYRAARPPAALLDELPALAGRIAVAWLAAAALLATREPVLALGPGALAAGYAAHLTALAACRAAVHHGRRRAVRNQPRSALVVGPATAAQRLAALLHQHPEYGVRPVGVVGTAGQDIPQPAAAEPGTLRAPLPLLCTPEEIQRAVIQNCVRDAFLVAADDAPARGGGDLAALLRRHGCTTWLVGPAHGGGAVPMHRHLWGYELRALPDPGAPRRSRLPKRALDLALAVPLLLAAAPVLLLCAAAVRLSDGPGVLFRQERVGENGRLFTLLKFRTLRPADATEAATRWNVADDDRLGAVGSFLRRTSLDELPQLWNVLRGDMSLVGPRPERPYFVERFSRMHPGYAARHRMPVGLTGLAQVHGLRGDTSIEDRCRFDNHYIDHWSLWQDVCILLRTAATLIRPAGG
ncbi:MULTISPECIES: exopolysaccharide biosynthesis polyprenyl glycosylphosphotransferase [unclassified Streptomyces]|uniref:exopolysaccharide biosynthesis polyprenyl glycosylphosphotransferase n=1 Tax=unclassified Streptomyces TaxID=2593676 RepID=UPI0009A0BD7B|nr:MULTISPECIES: exopolysaccharide biosynthesis polyprenyl glycosylphosphotransferase [unclassified Streptomyces]